MGTPPPGSAGAGHGRRRLVGVKKINPKQSQAALGNLVEGERA